MKFFDKLTGKARRDEEAEKQRLSAERKAKREAKKETAAKKIKSSKDTATEAGEPYVSILNIEIDPADPGNGAFELDFNDVFVARLIKAGYSGKTDVDIVDNWFKTICRNVLLETYEQDQADPANRANNRRDLGDGRTEVS